MAGHIDEVLHYEEVARKAHCLHYIKLELDALLQLGCQRRPVAAFGPFVGEFRQIVGLEFYTVELVVATKFVNFFLSGFWREHHVAVFVLRELVKKLLLGDAAAIFLLRAEIGRNLEEGHDRRMVYGVDLYLVKNLQGVFKRLRQVGEHSRHLGL